jgi:hypothetical protein
MDTPNLSVYNPAPPTNRYSGIDYLDPSQAGNLDFQRRQKTLALDRQLQYDMTLYGGDQKKIQARQLQYVADKNRLNSELNAGQDAGIYDPLYDQNAQAAKSKLAYSQYQQQTKQKQSAQDDEQAKLVASGRDYIGGAELYPGYDAQQARQNAAATAQQAQTQRYRTPVGWSDKAPDYAQYSSSPAIINSPPLSNPATSYTGQGGSDIRNPGNHGYMVPMTVDESLASGTANPRDALAGRAAQMRMAASNPYAR